MGVCAFFTDIRLLSSILQLPTPPTLPGVPAPQSNYRSPGGGGAMVLQQLRYSSSDWKWLVYFYLCNDTGNAITNLLIRDRRSSFYDSPADYFKLNAPMWLRKCRFKRG